MNKKINILIIILVTSCSNVFSQQDFRNGFIITLENDTIKGEVDYRQNLKNYETCIFRNEQNVREFFPNEINGFGYIEDKFFSSQIVDSSFVEVLVLGELSLYKSKDMFHLKKDSLLYDLESNIEEVKIDGKIGKREKGKWRGVTSYLISDCLVNSNSAAANIRLDEKSLTNLTIKYNKCRGSEFIEYKASKPWTKLELGVSAGISRSIIQFKDEGGLFTYLDKSYSSTDPTGGLLMTISSPRISEKLAFQGEIHFIKSSYSSLIEVGRSSTEYHETFIDLSTLSVPLSFKYSFIKRKYGFNLQSGIAFEYHFNSDTKLQSERVTGTVVNTFPEMTAFKINQNQIGYWGGLEIVKSYNRYKGSISLRYFKMSTLNEEPGFSSYVSRISINLIVIKK